MRQLAGGPEIRLTSDPGDDVQPSYSPDGRRIAFVSSREGATPIIRMAPAAQGLIAATSGRCRRSAGRRAGSQRAATSRRGHPTARSSCTRRRLVRSAPDGVPADGGDPREIPVTFATPGARGVFAFPRCRPTIAGSRSATTRASSSWRARVAGRAARRGRRRNVDTRRPRHGLHEHDHDRNGSLWQLPVDPATGRATGPAFR